MLGQNNNVITQQLGNGIEIMIEGLPQSVMTPDIQAKAALSLVQYGIPFGVNLTAGIIGDRVRESALKIGSQIYKFKYCIRAMRAITALEVYSQAIQWIEFQKSYNRVDSILADQTIAYLREDCMRQINKWV